MTMCLPDFLEGIFMEINAGRMSGVLFLDLKKAFNCVDRKLLIIKLCDTGLDSTVIAWIYSYLAGRYRARRVIDVT